MTSLTSMPDAQHDLAVGRPAGVGSRAVTLDRERRRHGRADIVEVEQHAVAQALDEPPVVRGQDVALHVLDEIEPMRDDAHLVLFDQTHRSDDVGQQHRALGPRDRVLRPVVPSDRNQPCDPHVVRPD